MRKSIPSGPIVYQEPIAKAEYLKKRAVQEYQRIFQETINRYKIPQQNKLTEESKLFENSLWTIFKFKLETCMRYHECEFFSILSPLEIQFHHAWHNYIHFFCLFLFLTIRQFLQIFYRFINGWSRFHWK